MEMLFSYEEVLYLNVHVGAKCKWMNDICPYFRKCMDCCHVKSWKLGKPDQVQKYNVDFVYHSSCSVTGVFEFCSVFNSFCSTIV